MPTLLLEEALAWAPLRNLVSPNFSHTSNFYSPRPEASVNNNGCPNSGMSSPTPTAGSSSCSSESRRRTGRDIDGSLDGGFEAAARSIRPEIAPRSRSLSSSRSWCFLRVRGATSHPTCSPSRSKYIFSRHMLQVQGTFFIAAVKDMGGRDRASSDDEWSGLIL